MSSDLSIDSFDDSLSEFRLAPRLIYSDWYDHIITWKDSPELRSFIEQTICEIYDSGDQSLAYQLAAVYLEQIDHRYTIQQIKKSSPPASMVFDPQRLREFYDRSICEQNQILYESGLIPDPPPPEAIAPISETNYPALWAWQTYCLENGIFLSPSKEHSGGFKEFWKEHKKAIIIAAVVIAVAATVAVVIVTTAGAGTNIAVATGAGAVRAAMDSFSEDADPNVEILPHDPHVDEAIRNFAKTVGAIDVNKDNGAISVIETNSISSEVTPEILTDLVANWNLAIQQSTPEIILHPPLQQLTTNEAAGSLEPSQSSIPPMQSDLQPSSLLPWINEGTSYFQWKERNFQEQLFKELENKGKVSSAFDEVLSKVTNSSEWVDPPQETRPRFNDRIVEDFLNDKARIPNSSSKNNFASKAGRFFDGFQSPSPYPKTNLIGNLDQSTIHYHCGIGNDDSDVVQGGACLYETLREEFAIQPHRIHSESVGSGLGFVALEQIEKNQAQVRELQQGFTFKEDDTLKLPQVILGYSKIQKSIDYEIENLSKIAQNIIEQNNPKLKQVHVTFSNGGYIFKEALKQMPPEYRETIIVITTGTTAIIDQDSAHIVYNLIGAKDKGSQLCNGGLGGIEKRKEKANVDIIPQTETQKWVGGHYFMQPDYQNGISDYLKTEIIGKYEIY